MLFKIHTKIAANMKFIKDYVPQFTYHISMPCKNISAYTKNPLPYDSGF